MPRETAGIGDELDRTARFYDAAAGDYDAHVDGRFCNASIREAFRARVSAAAGPAGLILDFGCGTGTDAAWYAAHGHPVIAYDLAPRMVDALCRRCRVEIEAGLVTALAGRIEVLMPVLDRAGAVKVIAANFGVLNHLRDLRPLLRMLGPRLVADGALIASLLNPFYLNDMKQAWWWRGAIRSLTTGAIAVAGDVTTYRHRVRSVRRAAAPDLVLTDVGTAAGNRWTDVATSNFLILVLRKRP